MDTINTQIVSIFPMVLLVSMGIRTLIKYLPGFDRCLVFLSCSLLSFVFQLVCAAERGLRPTHDTMEFYQNNLRAFGPNPTFRCTHQLKTKQSRKQDKKRYTRIKTGLMDNQSKLPFRVLKPLV